MPWGKGSTRVELDATGMASNGQAVARDAAGKVVFVEGALPGERVVAEVTSHHKTYASATTVEVLEASPARIRPPCPELARGCGACPWQHVDPPVQRMLKKEQIAEAIRRIGGVEPPQLGDTVELATWGYRTTLRAGVVDGRAGLRRPRSKGLVSAERCMVVHPLISELLHGRRYHGAREVVLRCGVASGERLVATRPAGVAVEVPGDVVGDHVHENVAGRTWRISARSFFQSRPDGAEALARLVVAAAQDLGATSEALDLYSGVGLFAGVLADRGWTVTAVEGSAASYADAKVNLAGTGAQVVRADVTRWDPTPADLVVADPSRAGLGRGGVAAVAGSRAGRVVLISCDPASLGRDVGILAGEGFTLTSVTPVDLFPHSFRVEAVSILDR